MKSRVPRAIDRSFNFEHIERNNKILITLVFGDISPMCFSWCGNIKYRFPDFCESKISTWMLHNVIFTLSIPCHSKNNYEERCIIKYLAGKIIHTQSIFLGFGPLEVNFLLALA